MAKEHKNKNNMRAQVQTKATTNEKRKKGKSISEDFISAHCTLLI
jgi:hypothetical protein